MKPSLLYRIASILLILFAVGHTLGFRQVDPKWGVDSLIQSMRSVHFNANGSERTYWDFFVGFGLFVTALMVLASVIAWQLGSLPAATLASMRLSAWGFRSLLCLRRLSELALFFPGSGDLFDCNPRMSHFSGVALRESALVSRRVRYRLRVESYLVSAKRVLDGVLSGRRNRVHQLRRKSRGVHRAICDGSH
jgi:hypothetical protein